MINTRTILWNTFSYAALAFADFFNWNRVKVRYCDGASFAGDSENKVLNPSFLHKFMTWWWFSRGFWHNTNRNLNVFRFSAGCRAAVQRTTYLACCNAGTNVPGNALCRQGISTSLQLLLYNICGIIISYFVFR